MEHITRLILKNCHQLLTCDVDRHDVLGVLYDCSVLIEDGVVKEIADYDFLGVYACRVLVPGVSEIYPVEELTHYNNNVGNRLRERILSLPKAPVSEHFQQVLAWLDDSSLDDAERLSQVLGLSVEDTNPWHYVRLGELRAYCYLALSDWDNALDAVEWTLTFVGQAMPAKRQRFFACLKEQLIIQLNPELQFAHYADIHRQVFGEATYQAALAHLQGEAFLYDLTAEDADLSGFANHQRWLSRYRVWQQVKGGLKGG